MQVTGYIITEAPLAASQSKLDITSSISAYSFSDGLHTYPSTDPSVLRPRPFLASTDAAGNITSLSVVLARWQSNIEPHGVGSRVDFVELGGYNAGLNVNYDQGETNVACTTYVSGTDQCTGTTVDGSSSRGASSPLGVWTTAAFDLNRRGLTGSWFQAATSGQGVELEIYPDLIASGTGFLQGAWFTYDYKTPDGPASQRWYTFSGSVQSGQTTSTLTLYENTGGNFNGLPITTAMPVGSTLLSAVDCNHTSMTYAFTDGSGRSGTIPMTRLLPNVTCANSGAEPSSADFGYSGNWYDKTTSGQGIVFELNPNQPLAWLTWYTYAPNGQTLAEAGQRWYTAQAAYVPGARSIPMTLYETTGGLFDKSPPVPSTKSVGMATATFTTCNALKLDFNFTDGSSAGTSGTINMTRVGPTPAGCGP
jgi:hypothetical protein